MIAIIVEIISAIEETCTLIVENIYIIVKNKSIIMERMDIIMEFGATIEKTITTIMEKYPKVSIIVEKDQQLW